MTVLKLAGHGDQEVTSPFSLLQYHTASNHRRHNPEVSALILHRQKRS